MDKPRELRIDARVGKAANGPASLASFEVTVGQEIETEWLVQSPQISLYCLDAASSQAIFVELPAEVNLAAAPFVYQAQYEGAQRLFSLPYPSFLQLAESIETNLDRLILLFNHGRCGSTLLHHVFNQIPGVVSLSEPDGFIPFWSQASRLPSDEAAKLMQAAAKFLFRPQLFPDLAVPVIKFRGRNLMQLALCHATFPNAR
jgi:hypothetical protein